MKMEVDYSLNKMDRPNDCIDNNNFRRGWEACLEVLRKEGQHIKYDGLNPYGIIFSRVIMKGEKGTLVFIPS